MVGQSSFFDLAVLALHVAWQDGHDTIKIVLDVTVLICQDIQDLIETIAVGKLAEIFGFWFKGQVQVSRSAVEKINEASSIVGAEVDNVEPQLLFGLEERFIEELEVCCFA